MTGVGNVMLHIGACYIYGHVTYTGMLHIRACFIYGRVTYTGELHIRAIKSVFISVLIFF